MKSPPNSTNGVIVLHDSFATSIFWRGFLRILDKDEKDFLEMGFSATFDVQHSSGQQRPRVTTVARNCAETGSSRTAASFDEGATAALIARIAVFKGEINDSPDVLYWLDRMLIRLCQKFADYRKLNEEDVNNSLMTIQLTLVLYTFDVPLQPALLDSVSIKADALLLWDAFFHILIFHGKTVTQWRKVGHRDQEVYENFKELLEAPVTDALLYGHSGRFALEQTIPIDAVLTKKDARDWDSL
ncbi:hypothetical protein PISMIDRAFT_16651 [Pisolithus microcarpus 441]|uniref:Protein transport protein SEC23 n=1 Tax=Pisolithus microcarpus 441 TaxID=765257 RepID=A0A0C9Z5H9_9AGAM|nr:hypothetical protein PISMIDRAFT_16651 [Pisolithus microcarpus 441]